MKRFSYAKYSAKNETVSDNRGVQKHTVSTGAPCVLKTLRSLQQKPRSRGLKPPYMCLWAGIYMVMNSDDYQSNLQTLGLKLHKNGSFKAMFSPSQAFITTQSL